MSHRYVYGCAISLSFAVLLSGCACSVGITPPPSGPSFKVAVDPKLKPSYDTLPRYPDGGVRPLAALTDKSGKITAFVENELMVEFATPEELNVFLEQWHGKVLASDDPKTAGIEANPTYLIRVQTDGIDGSNLPANLSKLNPRGGGDIIVSSEAARRLIAVGANAAMAGKHVGINYVTTSNGFQDGKLAEAPTSGNSMIADNGMTVENWNPNPFTWVYMKKGGPLDIGVGVAWAVLERAGRLNNKVKIAVMDGGFGGADDFPTPFELNNASISAHDPTGPNQNDCSGTPCPWHGWNVVNAAMGQVNNGNGAAGPAGPVAKLLAIHTSDVFGDLQAITVALFSGANIINMSGSARVPATLSWSVIPFNLQTTRAHDAGKLLVASAGNDSEDINEEDCFIVCWEVAWWTPCENGGVVCVGAMDAGGPSRRSTSNYGGDELDIWGPGSVWVAGDFVDNSPHIFAGTSAAAPFIAGVAALIWAAQPGLSNNEVENIMYDTAHHGGSGQIERWPDAYAAVIRALGGTPPEIHIAVGNAQVFGACSTLFQFNATVIDPDDGPPLVTWTSDRDGALGTGTFMTRALSSGTHHITATARDGKGLQSLSNEVTLQVDNTTVAPLPTIDILSLVNHQKFAANQSVTLEAGGLDPNRALGQLLPAKVHWRSSKDGDLGSGQRLFRTLSVGSHLIFVDYTGACGGTADDLRLIEITPALRDAPPNMTITTPSHNDLVVYADASGQGCLAVAGFGFDEEDRDFATIEWWETNRNDLQWKVLSFDQNTNVCLKIATNPDPVPTTHEVRLRGKDRTGHTAYSAPLRVTVLPGLR
jgi:hypothetical protein